MLGRARRGFCVEYFPRVVQGGRGMDWGSVGCFATRREARRRAQKIVRFGFRKQVRVVERK